MAASWFPMWGRDFLAGTLGWTAEERGHYTVLLITQWEQGSLPDDVKRLELISPGIRSCWPQVESKFPVWSDGRRRNNRLEHERSKAHERSDKARQSASQRWAAGVAADSPSCPSPQPTQSDGICERICERTSEGICSSDASIAIVITPPPTGDETGWKRAWPGLLQAWNDGAAEGHRRPWQSSEPPEGLEDRLRAPGWLDEAMLAIPLLVQLRPALPRPITLGGFCKPGFVAKVLGGYWRDRPRTRSRPSPDDKPPPVVDPAFAAAREATLAREAARREQEHRRLDEMAGDEPGDVPARKLVRKLKVAT